MRRRAVLIHAGSLASTQAMQFGVSLVLVRPADAARVGLFAIASALVGAAHGARDLGVSAYLQREPSLDAARLRAALGLSCAAGAMLAVALTLLAPVVAAAFGEPELAALLRTLSLGLVLVPIGAVMTALALRSGDAAPARTTAWGNGSQAAVSIALAVAGAGAAAPAWGQVVNMGACSLAVWPLRPRALWGWPRLRGWTPILRVGRSTLPGTTLAAIQGAAPSLLLGQWGGAAQVGLLGRAQSLAALLPGMAGMALQFGMLGRWARRHHRGRALGPAVAAATRRLTGLTWPLLAVAAALAEPLVLTLFGPAWRDAAPAVAPLALLTALAAVFNGAGPALTAIGRQAWATLPQAVTLSAWLGLAAGFALPGGAAGAHRFAQWLLIGGAAALPCQLWLYGRWLGVSPALLLRALAPNAAVALTAGAAAWLGAVAAPAGVPAPAVVAAGLAAALPAWWLAVRCRAIAARGTSTAPRPRAQARLRRTIRK